MHNKLIKITTAAVVISMFSISAAAEETCLTLADNAKAVYTQNINAVIDSVTVTKEDVKIYFKDSTNGIEYISWDDEAHISFSISDKQISYNELQENDVITLSYNVLSYDKTGINVDYCVGEVSRDVVCGMLSDYNEERAIISVEGSDYTVLDMYDMNVPEPHGEYSFYLDSDGDVAYIDYAGGYSINMVVEMYRKEGIIQPIIKLIDTDGNIAEYECKNQKEVLKFYNFVANAVEDDEIEPTDTLPEKDVYFTKQMAEKAIMSGKTMFRCWSKGRRRVALGKELEGKGGRDLEYNQASSRMGSYSMMDGTDIIDLRKYISDDEVSIISPGELENGHKYNIYLFDRNFNGDYRYGIWVK